MTKNIYKENYQLKKKLKECEEAFKDIRSVMISIGGGLNDNIKGYTKEQMRDLFKMDEIAKYMIREVQK